MTRHIPIQRRQEEAFKAWCETLQSFAMCEAEQIPDPTAEFWRECFNDGMSPEQAFRESFTEQDGI